jgi:hypothetical protein
MLLVNNINLSDMLNVLHLITHITTRLQQLQLCSGKQNSGSALYYHSTKIQDPFAMPHKNEK